MIIRSRLSLFCPTYVLKCARKIFDYSDYSKKSLNPAELCYESKRRIFNRSCNIKIHKKINLDFNFHISNICNYSTEIEKKVNLNTLHNQALREDQNIIVQKETNILIKISESLEILNAPKEDILALNESIEQLKGLFLLVIIGEFNSGKSSFLNALLGKKYLKEGVTPTTDKVNILRYGPEVKSKPSCVYLKASSPKSTGDNVFSPHIEINLPVPWLKKISLVDTPGTNSIVRGHYEITEHFVPKSDLILFITSVDRAFTESERDFLEKIRSYGKKIVLVLSKIDLLKSEQELRQIIDFVTKQYRNLFGFNPQIFPVSSTLALNAKWSVPEQTLEDDNKNIEYLNELPEWKESGFQDLENYILKTLDTEEKLKLKISNLLGLAQYFTDRYLKEVENNFDLLKEDIKTLERIKNEMEIFEQEMLAEYLYHEEKIELILLKLRQRANDFIEDNITFKNALNLLNIKKISRDFEEIVVTDTSQQIEMYINHMIDWVFDKQSKEWSRIIDYVHTRELLTKILPKNKIGNISTQYNFSRTSLITNLSDKANSIMKKFDQKSEANNIAIGVKNALYSTLAMEIGAIGLGTISSLSIMDLSGILGIGVLAVSGIAILPYKKRKIREELDKKIENLRVILKRSLRQNFEIELHKGMKGLNENILPYSRLVFTEKSKLEKVKGALNEANNDLEKLSSQVESEFRLA